MKFARRILTVLGALSSLGAAPWARATTHSLSLPKGRDSFFVEDDLVYSRYLSLSHDGTYLQIDQDHAATVEVDHGKWEQGSGAVVSLHSERRGLRFRSVWSGPLAVVLDSPGKIEALPALAAAIRRLLANSQDDVFEADAARELSAPPAGIHVDQGAETFGRGDLTALAAQLDDVYQTEQTRTYRLTPVLAKGGPLLLVLVGAVFTPTEVEQTRRKYHVASGEAPPFYFAQTDARAFATRVGHYQVLPSPGVPSNP